MDNKWEKPFDYTATKAGKVIIKRCGQLAVTLVGHKAATFMEEILDADYEEAQLLMARVTGQYKFGNERIGKQAMQRKGLLE